VTRACLGAGVPVTMTGRVRRTAGVRRLVRETLTPVYRCLDLHCNALEARAKRTGVDLNLTNFAMHTARWAGG
jgi:hypothetical protein